MCRYLFTASVQPTIPKSRKAPAQPAVGAAALPLQDLLTQALSKPWTEQQQQTLREMNGAETVMQAVARVNQLSRSRQASDVTAAGVAAAAAEEEGQAAGVQGSDPSTSSSSGSAGTHGGRPEGSRVASFSRTPHTGVSSRSLSQFSSAQFSSAPTLGAVFSYTGGDGSFSALPQFSHRGEGSLGAEWQANSCDWGQQQQQQHSGALASQQGQGDEAPPTGSKLNPLPPPPSARGERVAWDQWQPTVSTVLEEGEKRAQGSSWAMLICAGMHTSACELCCLQLLTFDCFHFGESLIEAGQVMQRMFWLTQPAAFSGQVLPSALSLGSC